MRHLLIAVFILLLAPLAALAQSVPAGPQPQVPQPQVPPLDDITISPSRVELVMPPGSQRTVVVNLIYTAVSGRAAPTRVLAYLGDWDISKDGKIGFYKPGTLENSACSWMIYSPVEDTLVPGRTHRIRVTISVPEGAAPGDHLAALFAEPRPDNIKTAQNQKQVQMKFRLASIFYIMVPGLTQKGTLSNLKAEAAEGRLVITPRFKNEGNSHIRPVYSVKVTDPAGVIVAEIANIESLPVLAHSETDLPVILEKNIPEGDYTVHYRVDLGDGGITEGETGLVVRQKPPVRTEAAAGAKEGKITN
jgi:hypothetical protein